MTMPSPGAGSHLPLRCNLCFPPAEDVSHIAGNQTFGLVLPAVVPSTDIARQPEIFFQSFSAHSVMRQMPLIVLGLTGRIGIGVVSLEDRVY